LAGITCLLLLPCACVFHTPPPLPGELAAAKADPGERNESQSAETEGEVEAPEGTGLTFKKGDEPAMGMSPEELLAFNEAQGDPVGIFPLTRALEGLQGDGSLWAELHTDRGVISCELYEDRTPLTVANFVALARGLRPVLDRDTDTWTPRRYYDNTIFHRIIAGFIVQGGDPTGTGTGNPGYVVPDEYVPDLRHDEAGVLSMANRGGPTTGSAQFFITLGPAPNLDGTHTVFGKCDEAGVEIADDMASTPRDDHDKPLDPEVLKRVEIVRRAAE
jgi:cyclophilin family peptidyl-prolyl cis-trans isomerase